MKKFSSIGVAALLAVSVNPVSAGGLECAINDALSSQNIFGTPVEAFNHRFTIKPVQTSDINARQHTISGDILRHNQGGKDDRIAYRIVKENGAIKEVLLRINDGKWEPLSPRMTAALGDHAKSKPMSDAEQNSAASNMYNVGQGSWRNAVEYLVARIGVRHC